MRKITSYLLIALLLCGLFIGQTAYASEISEDDISLNPYYDAYFELLAKYQEDNYEQQIGDNALVYVHDMAEALTLMEEESLFRVLANVIPDEDINILFLTYDNTLGVSDEEFIEDYVTVLAPAHDNNVILAMNMDVEEIFIVTMGGYADILTDAEIDSCLNRGLSDMNNGLIGSGVEKIVKNLFNYIERATQEPVEAIPTENSPTPPQYTPKKHNPVILFLKENIGVMTLISLIATGMSGFILVSNHNSANRQIESQTYLKDNGFYKVLNKEETHVDTYHTVEYNYYGDSEDGGHAKVNNRPKKDIQINHNSKRF